MKCIIQLTATFDLRDHHCAYHDDADGECPLLIAPCFCHKSTGCVFLDLLRVCVCCPD